jgi:hypothetical protein
MNAWSPESTEWRTWTITAHGRLPPTGTSRAEASAPRSWKASETPGSPASARSHAGPSSATVRVIPVGVPVSRRPSRPRRSTAWLGELMAPLRTASISGSAAAGSSSGRGTAPT